MKIGRRNKDVPGLNMTSTADISFMLLVFFLVTTSMYEAKGLTRQLPPKDKHKDQKELMIDKENMMALKLDAKCTLTINDSTVDMANVKARMEEFIIRRGKQHLFTLDADPNCEYDAYFKLQQNLGEAYKEARETLAKKKFGHPLEELTSIDHDKVMAECPQRVAENYHENEVSPQPSSNGDEALKEQGQIMEGGRR